MGLFWFHMPLALGAGAQKITGRADLFGACLKALIGERYENWYARDIAPLSYDVEFSKVFPILVRFGAARKTRMSIRIPHLPLGFLVFLLCLKAAIAVAEQAQKPLVIFVDTLPIERPENCWKRYTIHIDYFLRILFGFVILW